MHHLKAKNTPKESGFLDFDVLVHGCPRIRRALWKRPLGMFSVITLQIKTITFKM